MKISYMQGCGNTFFVADALGTDLSDPQMEAAYHNLNGKMVVDGVIFLGRNKAGDKLAMNYFDVLRGTRKLIRAGMCGNGIRCVSRFAVDSGYESGSFFIETDDGYKEVSVGDGGLVSVNMGFPRGYQQLSPTDHYVDTGIPHYVRFTDELLVERTRSEGLALRDNPEVLTKIGNPRDILHFNHVRVDGDNKISILTREGGVEDVTQACGTGSVASAYVSRRVYGLDLPITVHNMGGDLSIDLTDDGQILMSGPAEYI